MRGRQGWEREVASAAIVREDEFVLVDPLAPADEADRETFWGRSTGRRASWRAARRPDVAWHLRSTAEVARATRDPRVAARRHGGRTGRPTASTSATSFPAGSARSTGTGRPRRSLVARAPSAPERRRHPRRAGGAAPASDSWVPEGLTGASAAALAPLLGLPVEVVLPAHGDPVLADGAAALERALRS